MQNNAIDEIFYQKIYSKISDNQQLRYSSNSYIPKTKVKRNTTSPRVITPVKKKVQKKKTISLSTYVSVWVISVIIALIVFPFVFKNFVSPVFTDKSVLPFRVDLNKIYSPTTQYLHNNEVFGIPMLRGAEKKHPSMADMYFSSNMPVLESKLQSLARQYPSIHPSVFVWDYETGKYAELNSEERFPAASIIKLPVLLQFFRSVEAGQHSIEDKMTLTDYYRAEGSGDIQFQRTGNEYSMDFLAKKMIQISDNSSTNMLMSSIGGMNDINRALRSWGITDTEVNNWLPDMKGTNVTTTKDLAKMLYNIGNEAFLSDSSREKIFEYMGGVKNNRLLQAGISPNAKIYHKTGDIGIMLGDAGIVVMPDGRKYIVSIIAKRPYNHHAGKEFTVKASSLIYDALSTRHLT